MDYDIVILGATCAALGLAAGLPADARTLLLEPTAMVGAEFIHAFRPGSDWPEQADSAPAQAILAAMRREQLFQDGDCRIYSAGAIFCDACRQLTADLLLETDLVARTRTQAGFDLPICNTHGFSQIKTRSVIDTTAAGLTPAPKSLNAILAARQPNPDTPVNVAGVTFRRENDPLTPTVLMKLTCKPDESIFAARHRLIECWQAMAADWPDWRIATIALAFDRTPAQPGMLTESLSQPEPGFYCLPSAGFANPLAAIDAGYRWGKGWSR